MSRAPDTDPTGPPASHSLEELCRDEFNDGWRVLHAPDRPGPYVRRKPPALYYHPPEGKSVVRLHDTAGAVVWEEWTRPGVSYHTLELETTDGRLAHGLLVRSD
ncbi:hypothetical protein [Gemmata massiliana]|uniref:hypothetical protein n=1 Tax=Gemmata massiliana TaxID=1210884 RepID=UPI0013A6EAF7|nr:hypothetical protein [Gemmata massiliana]